MQRWSGMSIFPYPKNYMPIMHFETNEKFSLKKNDRYNTTETQERQLWNSVYLSCYRIVGKKQAREIADKSVLNFRKRMTHVKFHEDDVKRNREMEREKEARKFRKKNPQPPQEYVHKRHFGISQADIKRLNGG